MNARLNYLPSSPGRMLDRLRIDKAWLIFCCVRLLYMLAAITVVPRFTQLGDTARYLSGPTFGSSSWWRDSTMFMDFWAHSIARVLGPFLVHIPFACLSLYGIHVVLRRLDLSRNERWILLGLLSVPSFGIWTSIVSKESVTVFFLGVLLGALLDVLDGRPIGRKLLVGIAVYLCAIFKPQYLAAVASGFVYLLLARGLRLGVYAKLALALAMIVAFIAVLYLAREPINQISFLIPLAFNNEGATRENTVWIRNYDVFRNAFGGMALALWGPTAQEALQKPFLALSFLESVALSFVCVAAAVKALALAVLRRRVNVVLLSLCAFVTFWLLFAHYPFGVLNPGSAVRYRSGFYAFLVMLLFYCYRRWCSGKPLVVGHVATRAGQR